MNRTNRRTKMLNALAAIALLVGAVSASVSVNQTNQERAAAAASQQQNPTVEIQAVEIDTEAPPIEVYGGF